MSFPPVCSPHDPIEQIGEDLFWVHGSINLNPLLRIPRNMGIVRDGGDLTLINPIRIRDAELAKLDELGTVKHIVRTGCFHGQDDPFYMDRYQAEFWCQPGGKTYTEPSIDHELSESAPLPFPEAKLFCFQGTVEPESVLLIERGNGLLVACDAIQHYGDYSNANLPARIISPWIGFPKTTIIGPFWMKLMTPKGESLKSEFARLEETFTNFDSLLSAHGTFLASGAKENLRRAIAKAYP